MSGFRHIGIIGLGRIGGSLAAALRASSQYDYRIAGFDPKPKTVEEASRRGIIHDIIDPDFDNLRRMDLVVLAAPVRTNISLIPAIKRHMAPGSVLVDVGATKRETVAAMDAVDAPVFCFGGRPATRGMPWGASAWEERLFEEQPFLIVRTQSSTSSAEELLRVLIHDLGAHMIITDAATNDRALAVTSQLPMLLANALVSLCARRVDDDQTPIMLDEIFAASTRAVMQPAENAADVLVTNRDLLAEAYDALDGEVRRLLGLLHRDVDGTRRELTSTRVARAQLLREEAP